MTSLAYPDASLKRFVAILLAAASLAVTSFVIAGVENARVVGACGWYTEHVNTGTTGPVHDSSNGATTYGYFYLTTYNDGCGDRYYNSKILLSNGHQSIQTSLVVGLRVWVCGSLVNVYSASGGGDAIQKSSDSYHYGNCGRQADNYLQTMIHNEPSYAENVVYWSPTRLQKYVNQG